MDEEIPDERERKGDELSLLEQCSICLDYLDPMRRLISRSQCYHEFHEGCLSEYVLSSAYPQNNGLMCYKCPMCRKEMYVVDRI